MVRTIAQSACKIDQPLRSWELRKGGVVAKINAAPQGGVARLELLLYLAMTTAVAASSTVRSTTATM
jgi:hypothetical protein